MFDTTTWKLREEWRAHGEPINGLSFTTDDTRLATRSATGQVKLWDVATQQNTLTLPLPAAQTYGLPSPVFSPDGTLMLAGYNDRGIQLWSTRGPLTEAPAVDPEYFHHSGWRRALQRTSAP